MSTPIETTASRPALDGQPPPEHPDGTPRAPAARPRLTLGAALFGALLALVLVAGIAPRVTRRQRLATAVATTTAAIPRVSVVQVGRVTGNSTVLLPGTLQPLLTTAVYARTPGYISRRLVDIGSRVRAGDLLAEIDAPDLDQQAAQARAVVAQNRASLQLARAELARWRSLAADSAVTVDELDQKQAAFNVAVANLNSARADLRRLSELQAYERVVAPFAGVITARNVDPGALVGTTGGATAALPTGSVSPAGSLFQIARIDSLRVYVTVPEEYATGVRVGEPAAVTMPELAGDTLRGRVARTSRSLDPSARTLLTEVDVANPAGVYLPGMYAEVQLQIDRAAPPLRVPATALVIRAGPPQVATVAPDSTVRYQTVRIGRDHGTWVEVTGGLVDGSTIVLNPTDDLSAGTRVRTVPADTATAGARPGQPAAPPAGARAGPSPNG